MKQAATPLFLVWALTGALFIPPVQPAHALPKPTTVWTAGGPAPEVGGDQRLDCRGAGCPALPPEIGPSCWWFSYEATAFAAPGAAGRLGCQAPGTHYFAALGGLKLEVTAGSSPAELQLPIPLPTRNAAALPSAPVANRHGARWMAGLLLLALMVLIPVAVWSRRRIPAWRMARTARDYAQRPDVQRLESLNLRVRRWLASQPANSKPDELLRELDLARFGGQPLNPDLLAFFSRGGRRNIQGSS